MSDDCLEVQLWSKVMSHDLPEAPNFLGTTSQLDAWQDVDREKHDRDCAIVIQYSVVRW